MKSETVLIERNRIPETDGVEKFRQRLSEFARVSSRTRFQRNLEDRLGTLLRVCGMSWRLEENASEDSEVSGSDPDSLLVPLKFQDGSSSLLTLHFTFPALSDAARESIYRSAGVVVSDLLKLECSHSHLHVDDTHFVNSISLSTPGMKRKGNGSNSGEVRFEPEMMVHRLRNSLTTILSAASQLLTSDSSLLDQGDHTLLESIQIAAENQEKLLKRLLEVYTIPKLNLHLFDLDERLKTVLEEVQAQIGVKLEIRAAQELMQIRSDPYLLRTIVTELILNAREATDQGPIGVTWTKSPSKATVLIGNQRSSSAPEFHGDSVRPFFTTKQGHFGLGLSIAMRNAALLGGSISFQNSENETVAVLSLPLLMNED